PISLEQPKAPAIVEAPTAQSVIENDLIVLSVSASGSGTLTYQWYKDDVALSNAGRISGAKSPSLKISEAELGDAGSYKVVVTNNISSVTTTPVTVSVSERTLASVLLSGATSAQVGEFIQL